MITGGLTGLKSVGRWTPCQTLLKRGFAPGPPTSNDDQKPKDSAAAEATQLAGQEKSTTLQDINTDSKAGEILTPSLVKATSTKDFILSVREEKLRQKAKEKGEEVDMMKLQENFRKGASTADLDSG